MVFIVSLGAICLTFLIAGLGVTELLLRVFWPLPITENFSFSRQLGWDRKPPFREIRAEGNAVASSADPLRILFVGDSFTHGTYWPHQVANNLASSGIDSIGWEIGVAGYGQVQELIKAQEYVAKLKPDFIILLFFAWNDLRDNYNYPAISYNPLLMMRPYLSRDNSEVVLPTNLREKVNSLELFRRSTRIIWYISKLFARHLGPEEISRWRIPLTMDVCEPSTWKPFYQLSAENNHFVASAWKSTEALFLKFKSLAATSRAQLLVIGIDNAFTVDPDVKTAFIQPDEEFIGDLPLKKFEEILQKHSIPHRNLLPDLLLLREKTEGKVYSDPPGEICGHLKIDAEKLLGNAVADWIKEQARQ